MEQAEQIARRAVALAPHHADSHAILRIVQLFRGDFGGAETHIDQAAAIDPGAAKVLHARAFCASSPDAGRRGARRYGRSCGAIHAIRRGWRRWFRSRFPTITTATTWRHWPRSRQAIEYQPDHALAYRWAAPSLGQLGRREEAAAMLRKAQEVSPVAFDFFVRARPP
jgi:tetratricopeptide (TPR) repeat protein